MIERKVLNAKAMFVWTIVILTMVVWASAADAGQVITKRFKQFNSVAESNAYFANPQAQLKEYMKRTSKQTRPKQHQKTISAIVHELIPAGKYTMVNVVTESSSIQSFFEDSVLAGMLRKGYPVQIVFFAKEIEGFKFYEPRLEWSY